MINVQSYAAHNDTTHCDASTSVHIGRFTMALPTPLNSSITPDELELVALEQLVDIVPLFRSDRIRLISVSPRPFECGSDARLHNITGNLWSFPTPCENQGPPVAREKLEAKKKVSVGRPVVALSWCVAPWGPICEREYLTHSSEFLQSRVVQETSAEGFSSLPFRFSEISKVILDVSVYLLHAKNSYIHAIIAHQMIYTILIKSVVFSRIYVKLGKPKVGKVSRN